MISRFSVSYNSIVPQGSACQSPSITWGSVSPSLVIPCFDDNSLDIEINTDVEGPYCITFIINCEGCDSCPPVYVEKCFCVDGGDCPGCHTCDDYVCVSICPDGKICDEDTCVSCVADEECPCDQVCNQGDCKCPSGKKKRPDGCCVECFDGEDLGNCRVCIDGEIVATTCPDGHCNPNTGDCQECLNNGHCSDEPNRCCIGGECDCCPGFILDPITNECVPAPPCTSAEDCWDTYGKCYTCTADGCQPVVCPTGFTCNPANGECVPECGNCPEGSGCINGMCIPCSELACLGGGLLCEFAVGCQCTPEQTCEYIDCDLDNVELEWKTTPDTPGTPVPGTGLPALQGTTSISPTGLISVQPPSGSTYQNHQFVLGASNGTSGTWTLEHAPGNTVALGTGTSVLFDLAGTSSSNGPNLVGFVVKFVETGTGRTATWAIYRTPTSPITAENVWNYEFTSTGNAPSFTGGMSGSVQLCSTNGNFVPTGVTNVVTTGDIVITFYPSGSGCLIASISGCGTWNGDVILACGGTTVTVPAPSFTKDPANCCSPTDPNCGGWSTGDPCTGITTQPITLVALPTYGLNGSGDGEFLVVADWTTAGLTFLQMFYLNPTPACWSATGDFSIVTNNAQSPFGPSVSNLSVVATLGDAGCIRLGYTCELRIAGCKKLQGEICLTECSGFTVDIIQTDTYTFMAAPSKQDENVSYVWTYPGLLNNTGQTVTITPQGGVTTLSVTASYGSPVKCVATDSISFNTVLPGCTNRTACNYSSTATTDDGSCVLVGEPGYDCALGGFQPPFINATSINTPTIQFKIAGTVINTNSQLNPGTYTVDVFIGGIQYCAKTLVVPQCYRCSAGVCIPSPTGDNTGAYSTSNCNNACFCDIEINVTQICNNNRAALVITATGDSGTYTATVNRVGGAQILAPTAFTDAGSVTTPLVCNGVYRIIVQGANCNKSIDYTASCFTCAASTSALSGISYDCPTNQLFATIVADACATGYTIQLIDNTNNVEVTQQFVSAGAKTIPVGVYPGDGSYTVRLTDSNGCVKNYPLLLNCNGTIADCPITSVGLSYSQSGSNVSFISNFVLDEAGSNYSVTIYTTTGASPGSCAGAEEDDDISTQNVVGALGNNVVNFPNAITMPGIATCYMVIVQKLGEDVACRLSAATQVVPGGAPPPCGIEITNVTYNTTTGEVLVSWSGDNTSNDLTIQVRTNGDNICSGGDPIVIDSSGNGEDGLNIPVGVVDQIQGTTQCLTVEIFDTSNPSCNDSTTYNLVGCTCQVTIDEDSIVVDPDAETVAFDYTTRCTSGDIVFDVTGDATGSDSAADGSEDGVTLTQSTVVSLNGYPSTGGNIQIEVSDNVDGACIALANVPLPQNCVSCGQIASIFLEGSVVTQVRDHSGNLVASGSLTASAAGEAVFDSTVEAGIIGAGGNFCLEADGVQLEYPRQSGVKINQDSTDYVALDHVLVTDSNYVGALKSYFGDCGCDIGRVCDYEYVIPILATTTQFSINYADNNPGSGYTLQYVSGITQSPSPSERAQIAADLQTLLENAACGYTVEEVVVTYGGSDELTIEINGTNAGLGIAFTTDSTDPSDEVYLQATQSNCV